MADQKKISLTQRELEEVMRPLWHCFGRYNEEGCDPKCSKRTHLLCRKVTLFLRRET